MQQRAFTILLLAVFIDLLDFGLLVPILPLLLTDQSSPYLMLGPGQEKLGLILLGGLGATYGFMQFLASPLLGQLADRYGRKPLLLLSLTGTLYLIHKVGRVMRQRNQGRILITGSIAGHVPGAFQAVYHGSKAFVDSFAVALRNELKDTNITVTCLQPGATETEFFERAGLEDTKVGQQKKADPADVAKQGFEAMMNGGGDVVPGFGNKMQVAMSGVMSEDRLAEQSRKQNAPGTGKK